MAVPKCQIKFVAILVKIHEWRLGLLEREEVRLPALPPFPESAPPAQFTVGDLNAHAKPSLNPGRSGGVSESSSVDDLPYGQVPADPRFQGWARLAIHSQTYR